VFFWAMASPFLLNSQTTLTLGQQVQVGPGTPTDYIIPALAGDLVVKLRGGDGGGIRFSGIFCETTVEGGSGANIDVTFEVGFAPGQLQPGGIIRVMAGEKGESDSKACGSGAASYAGGGGSSAILYLPPNADPLGMNWQLLAVAGGGGGAARPSSGIDRTGGGATASDPSGSVNGISGATSGNNGNKGTGNDFIEEGQPGAGYKGGACPNENAIDCVTFFRAYSLVESAQTTGNLIMVKLKDNSYYNYTGGDQEGIFGSGASLVGGNGFTGGGSGSTNAIFGPTAGGGGGGYSGGSVNYYFGGGGGSSYLTSGVTTLSSGVSPGANGASGHFAGYVQLTANEAPIITQANCQDQTVQLNANGTASFNVSQLNNGSTGYLPLSFAVNGQSTFNYSCSDIGTDGVILTLTDANGSTSTCAATITVEDNVGPTAACQDVTVELDANGNGFISTCSVDAGSSDACGAFVGLSLSQTSFNCGDLGSNTVTMTATDFYGNTSTCVSNVTVTDNMAPSLTCMNTTVQLNASGIASIAAADVSASTSDNCGTSVLSIDKSSFNCNETGLNPVTLTASDGNGNTSTCLAIVTVSDGSAPNALCKNATIYLDASGSGSITVNDINNGSNDACGISNISVSQTSFGCADVGNNTVTLTVTDNNNLTSTCNADVNVIDNTSPHALCNDITLQLNALGTATISNPDIDAGSNDACGIGSLALSQTAFDCDNVGSNTVTLTVSDVNSNTSTCTSTVTVEDNVAPNAICETTTIQLDANGMATILAGEVDKGSNDACGIASMTVSPEVIDCSYLGSDYGFTLTVTDNNGNSSDCFANIIVEDNNDPEIICPGPIVTGNDAGQCGANVDFQVTATDNCTDVTVVYAIYDEAGVFITEVESGDFFPVGTTIVGCTATDGSGNTATCIFDITVNDTEVPVITSCPENITLCGAQNVTWMPPTAEDNCAVVSSTNNYDPGDFFDVGTYTASYTFYDAAGLSVTCSFKITINPLPEVTIENSDLPEWCQGVQILTAKVTNTGDLEPPLSYSWSTGETGTDQITVFENGNYSVEVTDANSCSITAEILVDEDLAGSLSAHTIIIDEEISMTNSSVVSGGVGVLDADEVEIEDNSNIQTFLISAQADIDGSSTVEEWIEDDCEVDLPAFMSNNFNNNNHQTVPIGGTMTLSGFNYGIITVKKGATLFIDNSNMYVKKLTMEAGARLVFNQPGNMMIRQQLNIDEACNVNVGGPTVVIYVRSDISIKSGSNISANLYTLKTLEVNDSGNAQTTYMTGLFIAEELKSGDNVVWGWNPNCSSGAEGGTSQFSAAITAQPESIESNEIKEADGPKELTIFPNPTSGVLNVNIEFFLGQQVEYVIYDAHGKEVMRSKMGKLELPVITIDMSPEKFTNGIYLIRVQGEQEKMAIPFLVNK
jgi:hypothetical protein